MTNYFGIKKLIAVLFIPLLSACGPLIEFPGSGEAPRHFQLSPNGLSSLNNPGKQSEDITIYMERISSSGVLKTTGILVQSGSNELQYYKDALWVDRTPTLVERFLIEALASNGGLTVVGSQSIEIPAQYRLRIDLRNFSVQTKQIGSSDKVHVKLTAMLVRNGPIEVMDVKEFNIVSSITNGEIDNVITGFNDVMDGVAQELSNWVHVTLESKSS